MCALRFILFQTVIHRLFMSFITLKEMNIEGAAMVENVLVLGVGWGGGHRDDNCLSQGGERGVECASSLGYESLSWL